MFGYQTVLDKSMNGVKTLSDGKSIITDGVATHDNIVYTTNLKSSDAKTNLTNNTITTENINALLLNATNINANSETVGTLTCTNLNVDNYGLFVDGFNNNITSSLPTTMNNTLKVVGNEFTIENSNINQIGTTSTNNLKTTSINGTLTCQSDIVQTGGNTVLKNITSDNITMNSNKSITQSGSGITNSFGSTQVSNLTVTTSMTFPSSVTIPSATQTGDLSFTGGARITQDLTEAGTNYNTLMYSKISKADINGNITQSSGTSTLLNTTIAGTAEIQGNITQTSGQSILKAIGCDQITLNADKDIYFNNGTGKIDQSVSSGTNLLNAITMNANNNLQQSGTGILNQTGTGTNAFKSSSVTGTFSVSSSTTLSGNVQCNGTFTMGANRSISQPTGTTNNQLQTTTITNLTCPIATINTLATTSLSVGNVSNTEIQFLDGVIAPIQSQIDSINTTTSGNSTSISGITYNITTDTTNIDNNVNIPTGKILSVGSVSNVSSNIITLNSNYSNLDSSMNTVFNTISGFTYNSGTDTTTVDNNVTINKNLIVQGMNIKAEIDALDSSFTTGTLNSTTATITNLSSTNINASYIVSSRYLRTLDNALSPAPQSILFQSNYNLYYDNQASNSHHIFATYTSLGAQVIPLTLNAIGAFFNVAITCATNITSYTTTTNFLSVLNDLVVNGITTLGTTIINGLLTVSSITSPTTGNLSITTTSGKNLYLNNNKSSNLGDIYMNTSSTNSNVIVDNGDLTIMNGDLINILGSTTSLSSFFTYLRAKEILPFPSSDYVAVKTNLKADTTKVIISPSTYIGCWLVDEATTSLKINTMYPVPSSLKNAGTFDAVWLIAPGYKVTFYRFVNYEIRSNPNVIGVPIPVWSGSTDAERQMRTVDNTSGTAFISISSVDIYGTSDQVGSLKLYYQNNEITLPYFS